MEVLHGELIKLVKLETDENINEVDIDVELKKEFEGDFYYNDTPMKFLTKLETGSKISIIDPNTKRVILVTSKITDCVVCCLTSSNIWVAGNTHIKCGNDEVELKSLLPYVINSYMMFSTNTGIYSINTFDKFIEEA